MTHDCQYHFECERNLVTVQNDVPLLSPLLAQGKFYQVQGTGTRNVKRVQYLP
jgi:hypothetical protein